MPVLALCYIRPRLPEQMAKARTGRSAIWKPTSNRWRRLWTSTFGSSRPAHAPGSGPRARSDGGFASHHDSLSESAGSILRIARIRQCQIRRTMGFSGPPMHLCSPMVSLLPHPCQEHLRRPSEKSRRWGKLRQSCRSGPAGSLGHRMLRGFTGVRTLLPDAAMSPARGTNSSPEK